MSPKKLRELATWLENFAEMLFAGGSIDLSEAEKLGKVFDALNAAADAIEAEYGK